ncbi:glycosyltransferase [Psychromonas sp. KJ10-10]|uniref:glycosyltransferase n=1 Tax=Psychromonas sp. KJ10-10 TaxID=3391823 RepID=UPI0039B665C5
MQTYTFRLLSHEGFGRTVIEAQHRGTPVMASKIPVYDEVLGDSYVPIDNYQTPKAWQTCY